MHKDWLSSFDILQEKHQEATIPTAVQLDECPGNALKLPNPIPIFIFQEQITKAMACLKSGVGLCGVMGRQLKEWLLHHKVP